VLVTIPQLSRAALLLNGQSRTVDIFIDNLPASRWILQMADTFWLAG